MNITAKGDHDHGEVRKFLVEFLTTPVFQGYSDATSLRSACVPMREVGQCERCSLGSSPAHCCVNPDDLLDPSVPWSSHL